MGNFFTHCLYDGGIFHLYVIELYERHEVVYCARLCADSIGSGLASVIGKLEGIVVGAFAMFAAASIIILSFAVMFFVVALAAILFCRCCPCTRRIYQWGVTATVTPPYRKGRARYRGETAPTEEEEQDDRDTHDHQE